MIKLTNEEQQLWPMNRKQLLYGNEGIVIPKSVPKCSICNTKLEENDYYIDARYDRELCPTCHKQFILPLGDK